jgi:hypothetical protein
MRVVDASSAVRPGDKFRISRYHALLRSRRQITLPSARRAVASEFSKSVELEQRVSRLELRFQHIEDVMELQTKRLVAVQAQLDHLIARGQL